LLRLLKGGILRVLILFFATFLLADLIQLIKPVKFDLQKALLGKELFFDKNFSADKNISCASCHNPTVGWADRRKVSVGVFGRKGNIQSPTVLNAVFNFRQFWNGRAKDLKEQIRGPVCDYDEMGLSIKTIEKILNSSPYKEKFQKIYHKKYITYDMFADSVAEFEKALVTPNSKFDRFLRKEVNLTQEEKRGYFLFKRYGCITCHNGINIGGNSFQKMGVIFPLKKCVGDRFEITHKSFDKCLYKVPTLRNIALTAPYFHNASADNLYDAIQEMAYRNLGFKFDKKDALAIEAFLKTLTGKIPEIMKEGR
jgi:cytochrome c peroxidase